MNVTHSLIVVTLHD